ncbi:aldo/keto reductase [Sphingomonas sp. M1-B02]|uniref:aldo/keto reductase n=1 Tax=Sphingomonas sp. M1-B02 TaxID=3114300 RepID=UPI0022402E4F|nr:aldo/keto reductase [Sphingomonas sp. S6-11]UZK66569.1 aldo/keto reductase [Sphingomonas sp. S6-11]
MIARRAFGRTGIEVSSCTFGTAALAGSDLMEAKAALSLAFERGVNAVEVDAGDSASIDLLGGMLQREGARDRMHVLARLTSLLPFDLPSPHVMVGQAYPGRQLRAETEALLRQLGVERLGIAMLHAWCPEWLREGDWIETLDRLRQEGKIAGFGISLFDHDVDAGLEAVTSGLIDAVEVMYNIFDQGAAAALFPLCQRHGVAVIARAPLYYGALAGANLARGDWRAGYFYDAHRKETEARAGRIAEPGEAISDLALRFAQSHPAVSTVAVGMRTRAQVEANLRAFEQGPLDPEQQGSMAKHAWLCLSPHRAGSSAVGRTS